MKNLFRKFLISTILFIFICLPTVAPAKGLLPNCGSVIASSSQYKDCDFNDLVDGAQNFLNFLLDASIVITVVGLGYVGTKMWIASSSASESQKNTEALWQDLLQTAGLLLVFVVVKAFLSLVKNPSFDISPFIKI